MGLYIEFKLMGKFETENLEIIKPENREIQVPEFKLEEFEDSREEFEDLVKQLAPAIKNHEYNLVVGDDASGRVPTLVLGGLVKEIYKKDKVDPPQILFFIGGRKFKYYEEEEGLVSDFFQKLEEQKKIKTTPGKALVVTEYMSTGGTVASFTETFKKLGLSCDIAALSADESEKHYKDKHKYLDKLYIGDILRQRFHFYGSRVLAGVKQRPDSKIFASPLRVYQELVIAARKDTKTMIDYLKQVYDQEKEKIKEPDSV